MKRASPIARRAAIALAVAGACGGFAGHAGASDPGVATANAAATISFYADINNPINQPAIPNPLVVRPSTIPLTQDGSAALVQLHWTDWGSSTTNATGTESVSTCNPNCASAPRTSSPARLQLSKPGRVLGHEVYRCFTLTVTESPQTDAHECLQRIGQLYAYAPVPTPRPLAAGFYSVPGWFCAMSPAGVDCENPATGHAAHLRPNGKVSICTAGPAVCRVGNPGLHPPTLRRGRQVGSGPFRCTLARSGLTCVVIRTGRGFRIVNSNKVKTASG